MYVCGLVIPVAEEKREAYRVWAEKGAAFFREYGCLEIVESWEDFIPDGDQTDFRQAVAAQPGEKIVFTWQIWPDKAFFEAAEEKMHHDARMDNAGEPPFDAKRLILGCFQPLVASGRPQETNA
ncbi:MAG: RNA signal recognition particle [Sphingomonas sp. 28-66-16]|nr:MAG: RNA signal recognition particle [Sphingomonas sp. 28-66-16]